MNVKRNAWTPSGEIVAHCGEPVRDDADFFAPPPQEIGRVITADTTLSRDDLPRSASSIGTRTRLIALIVFLVVSALVILPFIFATSADKEVKVSNVIRILGLAFLVGGLVAVFVRTIMDKAHKNKLPSCSYVGANGIVRYTLKGCPEDGATPEVLLFDKAEDLLTRETRMHVNGVYQGTNYQYDWRNSAGDSLLAVKGLYKENSEKFKSYDRYFFLLSAEQQWCEHRFDRLEAEFKQTGHVDFPVDAKRAIRIGPGYIEFLWPDGDHRVAVEDFGDISLAEGVFRFKHHDATWLGRSGKFNFQYGALPNAKLFLVALEQLAGIYWPGDEVSASDAPS